MGSCVICLTDSLACIYVDSSEWQKRNIQPIIEKHLWWWHLKQPSSQTSSYICQQCWKMLSSFHTFYLEVEKLHQNYYEKHWPALKDSIENNNSKFEKSNEGDEHSSAQITEKDYVIRIATNNETIELLPCLERDSDAGNCTFYDAGTPEYKTFISKAENVKYLAKCSYQLFCDLCNITLKNFKDLRNHYRQGHGVTGYATCCRKRFYSRGQFADHLRVHENPFYFKCTICTRILSHRVSYEKHIQNHKQSKKRILICNTCETSFSKKDEYERHILSHSEDYNIKSKAKSSDYAENCEVSLNNEAFANISLNCFIASQNTETMEYHPVVKSESVACAQNVKQFDGNHFQQSSSIDPSIYINTSRNTKTKEICRVVKSDNGEIFKYTFIDDNTDCTNNNETNSCVTSTTYRSNIITENDQPNRVYCDICGKEFSGKTLLRRHQHRMHHTKDIQKEQICPFCSKVSPTMQSHRQHVRFNHTVGRVHGCYICGKKFKFPSYLKDHISTHTGIPLHYCPYCSRAFKSGANMYTHRKRVHPKEWQEERIKKLAAQKLGKLSTV